MEISKRLLIAFRQLKAGLVLVSQAVLLYGFSTLPGNTQEYSPYSKMDDPNIKHFYMGRQEIEIFDNTPIVKYRGGAGGAQSGTAPNGPIPLPASGFQQYSSNVHGGPPNLPKVENGVPHKTPPPASLKGNAAAKLKAGARGSGSMKKAASAPVIKTYKQTYRSRPQSQPTAASATAGGEFSSTQKVHGKLLPWANTRRKSSY